ncbi:hypothetical protein DOS84_18745 [Flavobacterium aquariorum]|uniref:Lipoprotein n=1 Tax=Flavobacterium aquariorum TaxID=2217670 RepID=A0A2W7TN22_9FLAO|nr:hypothetical protein [Flavobacterium aquariorum]PZX91843.1 hypothetical protein DOS84_18745 [Flavobacterium aquariorum]
MKKSFLKSLLFFSVLLSLIGCNSDDSESSGEPIVKELNGFKFENKFYPLSSLSINNFNQSDNPATLSNAIRFVFKSEVFHTVLGTDDFTNYNVIFIDYQDTKLKVRDINVFNDLEVYLDKCIAGNCTGDDFLFDDTVQSLYSKNVQLSIKYLSNTKIYVTFQFTRTDGKVLNGSYFGKYNF